MPILSKIMFASSVQNNSDVTQPFGQKVPPSDKNSFVYCVRAFFVRILTIVGSICSIVRKIFLFLIPKRKTEPTSSDLQAATSVSLHTTHTLETNAFPSAPSRANLVFMTTNAAFKVQCQNKAIINLLANLESTNSQLTRTALRTAQEHIIQNTSIRCIRMLSTEIKDMCIIIDKEAFYDFLDAKNDLSPNKPISQWSEESTALYIMEIYPESCVLPDLQQPLYAQVFAQLYDTTKKNHVLCSQILNLRDEGIAIPCQLSIDNEKDERKPQRYPSYVFLTRSDLNSAGKFRPEKSSIGAFFAQAEHTNIKNVYIAIEICITTPHKSQVFAQAIKNIMLCLFHLAQTKTIALTMEQIIFLVFPRDDPVAYSSKSLQNAMTCVPIFSHKTTSS